jgi:hypothetical protein
MVNRNHGRSIYYFSTRQSTSPSLYADGPQPEPTHVPNAFTSASGDPTPVEVEGYVDCVTWSEKVSDYSHQEDEPITFVVKYVSCHNKVSSETEGETTTTSNFVSTLVQYAPPPTYKCPINYDFYTEWQITLPSNGHYSVSYQRGSNFGVYVLSDWDFTHTYQNFGIFGEPDTQFYATRLTLNSGDIVTGLGSYCTP